MSYKIKVAWGTEAADKAEDNESRFLKKKVNGYDIQVYEFDTEKELEAFEKGIEEANGWMEYYSVRIKE